MRHQFAFEKLDVWQLAKKLVAEIYKITNSYPSQEKFGIISQINQAAISVSANFAKTSAKLEYFSKPDTYLYYLAAYESLMELASHLLISIELGLLKQEDCEKIEGLIDEIIIKIIIYFSPESIHSRLIRYNPINK